MYYYRADSLLPLLLFAIQFVLIWGGGCLIATFLFKLCVRERLFAGLGIGIGLFIVLGNLLSNVFNHLAAFWLASSLIMLSGLLVAWRSDRQIKWNLRTVFQPLQLVLFGVVLVTFMLINRGLAIFDDYHNLPLVSTMAAGDIPPRYYLNTGLEFAYHYGLHYFAAMMVSIGGFFPWSAYDFSKALSIALTVVLFWLWVYRICRNTIQASIATFIFTFAEGTRWLLLFLPESWLLKTGNNLQYLGSASASADNLYDLLQGAWNIEGAGLFPFPFAFVNGIIQPVSFAMGSNGALPVAGLVLLLLLWRRRWTWGTGIVYALVMAVLALVSEIYLVFVVVGLLYVWIRRGLMQRDLGARHLRVVIPALLFFVLLAALLQGGVLPSVLKELIMDVQGGDATSFGFAGFSLRSEAVILSSHLGPLSLLDGRQLLVALAEIGPILALVFLAIPWLKRNRRWNAAASGLAFGSLLLAVLSLFMLYGMERDSARIVSAACRIWMILGIPLLLRVFLKKKLWQAPIAIGSGLACMGGLMLFGIQLLSIPNPVQSYYLDGLDAYYSALYWDQLEEDAQVFDWIPYRAVTVFGRGVVAYEDFYHPLPSWLELVSDSDPYKLNAAGFGYVYLDDETWLRMSATEKARFSSECIVPIEVHTDSAANERYFLDIHDCEIEQ